MSAQLIALIALAAALSLYLIYDAIADTSPGIIRAIKRAWLEFEIAGYQRDIQQIHRQRENDKLAETQIKRELAAARMRLLDL